jgi:hypothetical protein
MTNDRRTTAGVVRRCAYGPCGKAFRTRRTWQKFCSDNCRIYAFYSRKARGAKIEEMKKRIEKLEALVKSQT